MKKNLLKVLSLAIVAVMAMSCVAFAAGVEGTYTDGTVTATVTGIGATDEVTILVVPAGTDLAAVTSADIIYIDQVTATEGTATFTFSTGDAAEKVDIYSGYTSMDVTSGALSDIYEEIVEPEPTAPEVDMEKSKMYTATKPFNLEGYRRIFVKLVENNGAWMPAHSDADSEIYYSAEIEGYDGLIKTTAADLTAALAELTWTNVAPTDEQKIAMYGDLKVDSKISALDYMGVKNNVLKKQDFTMKEFLVGDTNDDAKISALDYMEIKNKVLKKIDAFSTVTNRQ